MRVTRTTTTRITANAVATLLRRSSAKRWGTAIAEDTATATTHIT